MLLGLSEFGPTWRPKASLFPRVFHAHLLLAWWIPLFPRFPGHRTPSASETSPISTELTWHPIQQKGASHSSISARKFGDSTSVPSAEAPHAEMTVMLKAIQALACWRRPWTATSGFCTNRRPPHCLAASIQFPASAPWASRSMRAARVYATRSESNTESSTPSVPVKSPVHLLSDSEFHFCLSCVIALLVR